MRTIWKRLHNKFTPFSGASFLLGVAMFLLGTYLPLTQWDWANTPQFAKVMSFIAAVLAGVAIILFLYGIFKTKSEEASPSFKLLYGVKNDIRRLYKFEQLKAEEAGKKGLNSLKSALVLNCVRRDLKITPKVIFNPLNNDETERIFRSSNKKLGYKGGDEFSRKTLNEITKMGIAIDKCEVGISSLIEGNDAYNEINSKINDNRLYLKKDKEIKELKRLAYSLNTILLSILYYQTDIKQKSPDYSVPYGLMKDVLDEVMQKKLESL